MTHPGSTHQGRKIHVLLHTLNLFFSVSLAAVEEIGTNSKGRDGETAFIGYLFQFQSFGFPLLRITLKIDEIHGFHRVKTQFSSFADTVQGSHFTFLNGAIKTVKTDRELHKDTPLVFKQ